jgi:hypothetical protein
MKLMVLVETRKVGWQKCVVLGKTNSHPNCHPDPEISSGEGSLFVRRKQIMIKIIARTKEDPDPEEISGSGWQFGCMKLFSKFLVFNTPSLTFFKTCRFGRKAQYS